MRGLERKSPCVLLAEEVWGSGLQAMRSLGRAGVPVLIATAGEGAAVFGRSRYCTSAVDIDAADSNKFCTDLLNWLQAQLPDRTRRILAEDDRAVRLPIIPLSDRLVEHLHDHRDLFDDRYHLSIPSPAVTTALLDKAESLRVAGRAGLAVPRWLEIDEVEQLAELSTLRLPVAIRPTSWSTAGTAYFKIDVARDAAGLQTTTRTALERGARLIVQEYVEAREEDVELAITWNAGERSSPAVGSTIAVCTGRKRRQSAPEGGVMVWGEAAEIPDLRALARQFLAESGFSGLGGLEFIRANGVPWFIEFNPRAEAIHFLASRAGLDIVLMEYNFLSSGVLPATVPVQGRATAFVGAAWLARLMSQPSGWRTSVADRVAFGRSPGRIRSVWSPHDPLPSLALAIRLVGRGAKSLLNRVKGTT